MEEDSNRSIVFGCYGEVDASDLCSWVSSDGSLFFETLVNKLNIPELNDHVTVNSDTSNNMFDKVVTPDKYKFTLTFWKSILAWQEEAPGPATVHFTALLARVLNKYISWELQDTTTFRITKFIAAGLLKLLKLQATTSDDSPHPHRTTIPVLYRLYQLPRSSDPVSDFLALLMENLHKYTTYYVIKDESRDTKYHVVWLLKILEDLTFDDVGTVFELLKHSTPFVAEMFTLGTASGNRKPVTLIQYVIFKLSGLCTQIREKAQLSMLERVLVANLLSYNNLAVMVSSDVLVFLARLAPPHYVTSLITVLCDLTTHTKCDVRLANIKLTVSRLFPVADPAALKLIGPRLYRVENGLLELLPGDDLKKTDICRNVVKQWKCNATTADKLLKVLPCSTDATGLLVELSTQMERLKACRHKRNELEHVCLLLEGCLGSIGRNWKHYRNEGTLVHVLQSLEPLVQLKDTFISSLVLDVLDKLSAYKCPKHVLYCSVCTRLLSKLITSDDPYLSQKCVYTFATFAKMTPHPGILTAVAQDKRAKCLVTQFLQGNPSTSYRVAGFKPVAEWEAARLARTRASNRFIIESVIEELRDLNNIPSYYKVRLKQMLDKETAIGLACDGMEVNTYVNP